MTPTVLAAAALGVVLVAVAALVVQPRRAWREAAEHARLFWLIWALSWAALGLAIAVLAGPGWVGAGGLAGACLIGSAQPSMIADLLDVRRLGRLRRRQAWMPLAAPEPTLRPIAWEAPVGSTGADAVRIRGA